MPRVAIDSSAVVAILKREPEWKALAQVMGSSAVVIGWPTILEVRLWIVRNAPAGAPWFDRLLVEDGTSTIAFGREHEELARAASDRFGKGRHPAQLNFGACMAYAVAMAEGVPLLFKGTDFGRTDVAAHPASMLA